MLLSQVLAASTYPAEIQQAQQWMQANPGLRGRDLVEAAKQQNWDPSVQALVAFPDVMNLLTRDIQWTTALGNAFLSQQADLMDAIQRLRSQARDNGRLTNTPQERVTYEQQNGQNAIVIQPTDPQMVYPPAYNPEYVWGPPAYGAYPPLAYPSPDYGIVYGIGTFLGGLFAGLWSFGGWGWGLSWLTHGLFLNNLFFAHFGFHGFGGYGGGGYGGFYGRGYGYAARSVWVHNPGHRLGVPYGNRYAASRFGGYGGGNRQMDAYRALSERSSRGGFNNGGGYSYRGGGGYSARNESYGRGSNMPASFRNSESQSSRESFSSPHYSAPKSSGHFEGGGGGHFFGGGGHSNGGGGGHFFGGSGHSKGGGGHFGGGGGGHSHGGGGHSHGGHHR